MLVVEKKRWQLHLASFSPVLQMFFAGWISLSSVLPKGQEWREAGISSIQGSRAGTSLSPIPQVGFKLDCSKLTSIQNRFYQDLQGIEKSKAKSRHALSRRISWGTGMRYLVSEMEDVFQVRT